MKYKVGDKVRPTREAWAKEYKTEPPVFTVIQIDDATGKLVCETPGMNYHLLGEEDIEVTE